MVKNYILMLKSEVWQKEMLEEVKVRLKRRETETLESRKEISLNPKSEFRVLKTA